MIGVRDLPLRDMISLGAWRMGLGCSGKMFPSSPSPPSPTRVWEAGISTLHTNAAYQRCTPTLHTNAAYQRCIPTLPTNAAYQRCLPTLHSNAAYQRCIPTLHTNAGDHLGRLGTIWDLWVPSGTKIDQNIISYINLHIVSHTDPHHIVSHINPHIISYINPNISIEIY